MQYLLLISLRFCLPYPKLSFKTSDKLILQNHEDLETEDEVTDNPNGNLMTQIDKKEYKQLCVGAEKLETCIVLVGIKQEICVHLKKARYNNTTQKRRL